jgi:hypothetical protein
MDENHQPKRWQLIKCFTACLLFLCLALPLFYVLSIGPAALLVGHTREHGGPLDRIYWPVLAVAENWPACDKALTWYLGAWMRY